MDKFLVRIDRVPVDHDERKKLRASRHHRLRAKGLSDEQIKARDPYYIKHPYVQGKFCFSLIYGYAEVCGIGLECLDYQSWVRAQLRVGKTQAEKMEGLYDTEEEAREAAAKILPERQAAHNKRVAASRKDRSRK